MGCDYSKQAQEDFKTKISELSQTINYLQTQHATLVAELKDLKQKTEVAIPIDDIQSELGIQIKNIEDILNSIQKLPIRRQTTCFSRKEEYQFTPDHSPIHAEYRSNSSYISSSSSESEARSPITEETFNPNKGVIMEDPYIKAMVESKRKQLENKPNNTQSTRGTEIMKNAIYHDN